MECEMEQMEFHASEWNDLDFDFSLTPNLFPDLDAELLSVFQELEELAPVSSLLWNGKEVAPDSTLTPSAPISMDNTFECMRSLQLKSEDQEEEEKESLEFRERTVLQNVISRTMSGIEISWNLVEVGRPNCVPEVLLWIPKVSKLPSKSSSNLVTSGSLGTNAATKETQLTASDIVTVQEPNSSSNGFKSLEETSNSGSEVRDFSNEQDGSFNCPYCATKFSVKYMVKRHAAIHQGRNLFYCPHCNIPYRNKVTMGKHIREIHKDFSKHHQLN